MAKEVSFVERQRLEIEIRLNDELQRRKEEDVESNEDIFLIIQGELILSVYEFFLLKGWKLSVEEEQLQPDGEVKLKIRATKAGSPLISGVVEIQRQFIEERLESKQKIGADTYTFVGRLYLENHTYFRIKGYNLKEIISEKPDEKYGDMPIIRFEDLQSRKSKN